MDWKFLKEKISQIGSKYKYVFVIVLVGILLMSIPQKHDEQPETPNPVQQPDQKLSEKLEQILSQMEGVGKAQVLLTESDSARTVYQTNEQKSADGSVRGETVIVSDGSRGEGGLITSVTPPAYLGAIVVCQGADRPSVQLAVIQAVSNVTGISTDRITVVKMK